jgi:hypothetical protein
MIEDNIKSKMDKFYPEAGQLQRTHPKHSRQPVVNQLLIVPLSFLNLNFVII